MTLHKKLEILTEQYHLMIKHSAACKAIGSIIDYNSLDYDREGDLLRRIKETKDSIGNERI